MANQTNAANPMNTVNPDSKVAGVIRKCGVSDAQMLHKLSVETYFDTFGGTSSDADMRKFLEESYAVPVLRDELANHDSMFFVISMPSDVLDGTPAGYMKLNFGSAQLEDMGPGAMELQRLYIRKAFKGCGLGTRLMNLALQTARERDLNKVWLGVWEHNEPAKRFYTGKGFVRVGQHAFWQGDDKQTDYLMAREV
ncbi:GNAT family N-acetyltransferase [Bifidobacterium sp. ESL0764]|uniref:GNAT family N-acetyltransferase n=1 Tax=Bifidobacterium sp. ESL0764 TaxID=2983228 RepID=UPI0023F8A265|nr:GNAT family N-acetyltransferase [Bifidobacterium sp. ESL0764]WEV66072.1 GNAT family N-acetyltransferase [Bifidobacterium sp. ESL0764]